MGIAHADHVYSCCVPRRFPSSCDNLSLSRSKLFPVPLPSAVLPPPLLSSLSPLLLSLLIALPPPCVPWVAAPAVTNGAHNYGFTIRARCLFQAMLRILLRARAGYHLAEKDRAKLNGSKLGAHLGFASEGPKEIPSGLAGK